jgi:hypothetical protein
MIKTLKRTRNIVIKEIMRKCVDDTIEVNDGLIRIHEFDEEFKTCGAAIMHYQEMCIEYTDSDLPIGFEVSN